MELFRALGVNQKEVVAFVGGGGKTTAMFRLANELVAQGKRVVTTTTTRIFAAQIRLAPFVVFAESAEQSIRELQSALRNSPHVLLIGTKSEDGKAFGVDPALVDRLITLDEIDVVIVEADGSRMRPFKAPGEHEPVIPRSTTLLVPVVGIDVWGRVLDDENVHRAERVSALVGLPIGSCIGTEQIAAVLAHPVGGLKNRPPQARAIPLINKVENDEQLAQAQEIAELLLQNDTIDKVATGALHNVLSPISTLYARVSAVILAAGGSRRMQGNVKQLLRWGNASLVENAVKIAWESKVAEVVVVTGNQADLVETQIRLEPLPPGTAKSLRFARNFDWETGRASSIRTGIEGLSAQSTAAMFINADQPFLTVQVLNTILAEYYKTGARIVLPVYDGSPGSPVLFGRELFAPLCDLRGEQGGRDLLEKYQNDVEKVEISDVRAAFDLDTPEEYRAAGELR